MKNVRVRFAPSPTGYLHVGGARTALYNYLFAKKNNGKFILRIEDTDLERSTDEFMKLQMQDLLWLGLNWDEGVNLQGEDQGSFGPYRQSQRKSIYMDHAEKLLERDMAYYDFRGDEELEKLKAEAIKAGKAHQVERPEKIVPLAEARLRIAKGEKAAIRFKVGKKRDYVFKDLIRNEVTFPSDMVGDFVMIRSNGMPVYNFCCVIDDALMQISHVFRAEEHLSNTLRQIMLYEAFNYEIPEFGHLSIILGSDRQKLSKRHGATSCFEYKNRGFLPEALNNFILLLGWSSPKGQEILSRNEMIEQFSEDRFNAAAAVFDEQKLAWMNATYLRALSNEELVKRLEPFILEAGLELPADIQWKMRAVESLKSAMNTLTDVAMLFKPLSENGFEIDASSKEVLGFPTTKNVLKTWLDEISKTKVDYLTEANFMDLQNKVQAHCQVKGKALFQPIRVAVLGVPQGAELKVVVPLIHKKTLMNRAEKVLAIL